MRFPKTEITRLIADALGRHKARSPIDHPDGSVKARHLGDDVPEVGAVSIQDSGVDKGTASTINFKDNLAASVSGNVATVDGEAGGDVYHEVLLPVTDTLALNAESPHVPIILVPIASSVDKIYIRSKTNMTFTVTVYCYNQAGASQWGSPPTLAPSGELYKETTGLTLTIPEKGYLLAKITAYTSGGDEPIVAVRFKAATV